VTPAETARLLAAAAAYDRRTVGDMDVVAWHKAIGHLDAADSLEAVARHYATSREWIMPADVSAGVQAIRNERAATRHSEALALPSRFEADSDRDLRLQRGLVRCRDVIEPIVERLQAKRDDQPKTEADQRLEVARRRAKQIRRDREMAERLGYKRGQR
jgi:hypothetical protein